MFKNRKEAEALEDRNAVAAVIVLRETSLKQIDEQFSEVESTADVAEKIVKLQELVRYTNEADRNSAKKYNFIIDTIDNRIRNGKFYLFTSVSADQRKAAEKKKQLLERNPGLDDFATMTAQKTRASAMLDETIASLSINHLEEISDSPWFVKALKDCEPLQDLFNAAAVRRAALGEKPARKPVATPQKKTKARSPIKPLHLYPATR